MSKPATNPACEAGEIVVPPALGTGGAIQSALDPATTPLCITTPTGQGLFTAADPDGAAARTGVDFTALINPASLEEVTACRLEPMLASAPPGSRFQFERLGYFCVDTDSTPGRPTFNRTVSLKDTWARLAAREGA